jgi:lipoprotein-releasing system permease protein
MIKSFEWKIAKRYVGYNNHFISLVSYLATIGIALGVMILIIVMSIMNGYEVELIKKILGINGHISISTYNGKIANYIDYIDKIKANQNVKFVAPIATGQALAEGKDNSTGVLVRGMDFKSLKQKPIMKDAFVFKNNQTKFDADEIYIGNALAKNLRLHLGDKVRLIVPKFDETILGTMPKIKTFYVAGIFDIGMYEYNASTVFIPIKTAQLIFDIKNSITEIEVILNNIKNIEQVKESILKNIPNPSILITDWGAANQSLVSALRVERNTMFLILIFIVMIAAFNIISGLTMLVKEKYKSIAILRAIGVSRTSIIKIFVLVGSFLGFIGILTGAILGILFVVNIDNIKEILESLTGATLFDPMIYFLTSLPSEPDFNEIISIVFTAMIISLLATIYPAWKAANMMPSEALRYE